MKEVSGRGYESRIVVDDDNIGDLERQVARFEAILRSARDGLISIDSSGRVTLFNEGAERMFGYSASEVLGRNVALLMPDPYRREHDGYIRDYRQTGEARAIGRVRRVEGLRSSGEKFPIELSVSEARVGDEVLYTAIIRDVSEVERTRSDLDESRRALFALIANLPGAVYRMAASPGMPFDLVGDKIEDLTGYQAADFMQQKVVYADLVHPDDRERAADQIQDAIALKRGFRIEYRVCSADGRERWVRDQGRGVYDEEGRPEAIEGFLDALGLALGEAGGGEGIGPQKFSGDRTGFGPELEQIDLLLHGEETADLLEEGLKGFLGEVFVLITVESTAAFHQIQQQFQTVFPVAAVVQVAADQIQDSIGEQALEVVLQGLAQIGLLAHALQQLDALLQQLGGRFKAAVMAAIGPCALGGQAGQQGEIQFTAAAQGWCLGWLQGAPCPFKRFGWLTRLHQQQQGPHLVVARHLQGRLAAVVVAVEIGEQPFVMLPPLAVAEQISAAAQQQGPRFDGVAGEPIAGGPLQPLLKRAQHLFSACHGAYPQQAEMVEG